MGVQGLAPFLQRACPDVIRHLPTRLQEIKGKSIVIDATLITTRLHFSNMPYQKRHALGWYRLLTELQANRVGVICVFDGTGRVAAKRLENAKRRASRELMLSRAKLEESRVDRLRQFEGLIWQARQIPPDERNITQSILPKLAAEVKKRLEGLRIMPTAHPVAKNNDDILGPEDDLAELACGLMKTSLDHPRDVNAPTITSIEHQHQRERIHVAGQLSSSILNSEEASNTNPCLDPDAVPNIDIIPPSLSEDLPGDLQKLCDTFTGNMNVFNSSRAKTFRPSLAEANTGVDVDDVKADVALTRFQYDIALEEGKIWTSLSAEPVALANTALNLAILRQKSQSISETYKRRAEMPAPLVFEESKLMIEAMGIPWIESSAHEAEALASSLVINGYADYVVSEDTDVLIYQAPLIRGITAQSEPLTLTFGAEIAEKLRISTDSFIDFAVLIGTDFSTRLRGLGPVRALKLIQDYESIEGVLAHTKERYSPLPRATYDEYFAEIAAAREIFKNLPPVPSPDALLPLKPYDTQRVDDLLLQFGLHRAVALRADRSEALKTDFFASEGAHPTLEGDSLFAGAIYT